MKKLTSIITIFLLTMLFVLTGCDPNECDFKSYKILEDVVRVQLINYKNDDDINELLWTYGDVSDIKPYDFSKEAVIETLDESQIDSFVTEIKEIGFFITHSADAASGKSIKITKSDGYFMIFSGLEGSPDEIKDFVVLYNPAGVAQEQFGVYLNIDEFINCVDSYFELFS